MLVISHCTSFNDKDPEVIVNACIDDMACVQLSEPMWTSPECFQDSVSPNPQEKSNARTTQPLSE